MHIIVTWDNFLLNTLFVASLIAHIHLIHMLVIIVLEIFLYSTKKQIEWISFEDLFQHEFKCQIRAIQVG